MGKYVRKTRLPQWVHTGSYEVRSFYKNGMHTQICHTLEDAVASMQEAQQDSRNHRIALVRRLARIRHVRYGVNKQCKTCLSPYRALTEAKLLEGHSVLCVSWHLRRLNWSTMWMSLANHWHKHMVMFREPCWGIEPLAIHTAGISPRIVMYRGSDAPTWVYSTYPPVQQPVAQSLVLIRGIIGSGKSNIAHTYGLTHRHVETDQLFFTADGWFRRNERLQSAAHDACEDFTRACLADGESVVVSNTFCDNSELLPYLVFAQALQVPVHIIDLLPEAVPNSHQCHRNIERSTFNRQLRRWEPCLVHKLAWRIPVSYEARPLVEEHLSVPELPYICQPGTCPFSDVSSVSHRDTRN